MLIDHAKSHPILIAMCVLYLVLGLASCVVQFATSGNQSSQLRHQVNAWWLIFPVLSLSLLIYPLGPILLTLLIGLLALRELAVHYTGARWLFRAVAAVFLSMIITLGALRPDWMLSALPVLIALQLLQFLWQKKSDQLLLLMFLVSSFGVSFIIVPLHSSESEAYLPWLFYLFVLTALNDIGQFVSGKIFGKHRIAIKISPNKTWQGLLGGVLVTIFVSLTLGRYLHLADSAELALLGMLLALGGFLGDLLFSAAKRFLNIKDFSQLIPGHGGILDRVDSLVITAPLLYFFVTYF